MTANPCGRKKNPETVAVSRFVCLAQKEGFEPAFACSITLVALRIGENPLHFHYIFDVEKNSVNFSTERFLSC